LTAAALVAGPRWDDSVRILEISLIEVTPGREDEFAAACAEAKPVILSAQGCRSSRMRRGIETPARFVGLVEWDSVEAHRQNFRGTDLHARWSALPGPFVAGPPVVEHFIEVPA
jgi:heme-degrading monooxygenase HmoA